MKSIIIVESPTKAKTIESYLGKDYEVIASNGHVRDLPEKSFGVSVKKDFKPTYVVYPKKQKLVETLKEKAKEKFVYIATDADREGEAIGWHLSQILGLKVDQKNRLEFREITKAAITKALENPSSLDMNLVHSQETRRIIDRVIGFMLSGLVRTKIGSESAGRVQSVALRLVVENDQEINAFVPEDYSEIFAKFHGYNAGYIFNKKRLDRATIDYVLQHIGDNRDFEITDIKKSTLYNYPPTPFTTSSLQIELNHKYGYSATKTMKIAQELYEGIQMGTILTGLITYMRTDSIRLSDEFVTDTRELIKSKYGSRFVSNKDIGAKKQGNQVQDAHEAIRPSEISYDPEDIKGYLSGEQYRVYKTIYTRTIAYIMTACELSSTTLNMKIEGIEFESTKKVIVFPGYKVVYNKVDEDEQIDESDKAFQTLVKGDIVKALSIERLDKQTEPISRFSEAGLIKEMERLGIGRPSTYAPTVKLLFDRNYMELKDKKCYPTLMGTSLIEFLKEWFKNVVDYDYSKDMEDKLDSIATLETNELDILNKFYNDFIVSYTEAKNNAKSNQIKKETGELCPKCGAPLIEIKARKLGYVFIGCSQYPNCDYVKPRENKPAPKLGRLCPKCGMELVERKSKKGTTFVGCSGYPKCDYVEYDSDSGPQPVVIDRKCPTCGKDLVQRFGRKGLPFIACSGFPKCKYHEYSPIPPKKTEEPKP